MKLLVRFENGIPQRGIDDLGEYLGSKPVKINNSSYSFEIRYGYEELQERMWNYEMKGTYAVVY